MAPRPWVGRGLGSVGTRSRNREGETEDFWKRAVVGWLEAGTAVAGLGEEGWDGGRWSSHLPTLERPVSGHVGHYLGAKVVEDRTGQNGVDGRVGRHFDSSRPVGVGSVGEWASGQKQAASRRKKMEGSVVVGVGGGDE
ncbi:hypothetical protein GGTG_03595 [Gaeumannomyces tritici R3-111a-1]|uniref:Uncharacterized protein n=1 Tax=Gaeumannomyces tritici (strain R3-111a-1) TaxID=644352 RepID=J3NQN9_GAET3|nr:hypothetical protein GGTG_03595 [Gaeumannomyces tritici R3-111a-1]EJT78495.1 hypothetical protein GGTG_03595 [Gaeumannomyces tritici R3-111a-1]